MIRKAIVTDVKKIQKLIAGYAKKDRMLLRSLNELYENIRDFYVYAEGGTIYGCCALHVDWEDLAEIKSLAVAPSRGRRGIGKKLVQACLKEARALGISQVFTLTYIDKYFAKFGFSVIDKQKLPHKIWGECIKCVYFPNCNEIAMMKELKGATAKE